MATPRIEQLAKIIQENTTEFSNYINAQNLPQPSFEPGALPGYPLTPAAAQARTAALDAADELRALLEGPFMTVFNPAYSNDLVSIHAMYRFKLAESFPPGKDEATYEEIAQNCGLSEPMTRRLIRHAMTRRIFKERRPGVIAHTAISKMMADQEIVNQYVGMACEEYWISGPESIPSLLKWGESPEPNETAFSLGHNTDQAMYTTVSADPERAVRFAKSMQLVQNGPGFAAAHVADNYPWESLGSITIVDIGGSHGSILAAVARKSASAHCIVQDLEKVVEDAPQDLITEFPGRFEFMAHDMFKEQPVQNADFYMFRFIFHNWSDKYCKEMLRALIPALKAGAKIHIWDMLLPVPGETTPYEAHLKRSMDLLMWQLFNGKEREAGDWKALIEGADHRFQLIGINKFPSSELSLIEAEWKGD